MIRLTKFSDFSPQDGYPSDSTLRELHQLADSLPPVKARRLAAELLFAHCCSILGRGDREELLDEFFAGRERSRLRFLEGSGLEPDPEIDGRYLPGTWRLTREQAGQAWQFVIRGVRAASGRVIAVPLTEKQYRRAGSVLRVIRKAVAAPEHIGLTATQWRRIWDGFDYRDASGLKQHAAGLRIDLHRVDTATQTKNPLPSALGSGQFGKRYRAPTKRCKSIDDADVDIFARQRGTVNHFSHEGART